MMMTKNKQATGNRVYSRPAIGTSVLAFGLIILVGGMVLAISVGAAHLDFLTVWRSILHYEPAREADQIIVGIRLPRELGAAIVGAAFAVSGAIMQGMTRNSLADPGLLGLNAGASMALACAFAFHFTSDYLSIMIVSFIGAGIGAGLVFGLGSLRPGGMSPIRLTLAGAAVSALLTALAEGIALYYKLSQNLAFWTAGGVSGTNWLQLKLVFPAIVVGMVMAVMLSKGLTVLSFGEEMAKGLGQRTVWTKAVLTVAVLILAGAAVSLAGPVSFVGLIAPHIVRYLVGTDYRWIIPCSAVFGSIFMVLADTAARMVNAPYETPVGAIVSIIGVPFFLYLARKGGRT
ncbi:MULTISPECIES: iron ABC transporter permease [unclassified Thermoactinomyces]|jgi:iron complex transport system permease protein|uniref:FecCD family ABC transporter permease n=1 Tax=unclassified Thermoactinomyces TaxID=2634588 RepID=UPI0018DCDB5A|nr:MULTISPECIES: iron ABC transporter permease [unclassified Thermoactinomyces]MBH8599117.1 iron ABC transporter permease [Thermoactinomyces sp. CICC 10523]MBH8605756.1 iron ABC transporter permease [Thermoactinomyces sp. CICC 10522]MBH8607951.1 iron ABC transporter permease [Thermoactinomyces sp. CICC 10521]